MKQSKGEAAGERMMTAQHVADFLQVSICSVRRWSDKGALKFYRVGSRGDRRYWREDVIRYLEESSPHLTPDATR